MSVNKVILVGNVGKDPEVKHLESNVSVANFSLATSETYTNKNGEKVTTTEWHNIVCWRNQATFAENFIRKGSQIYIDGKIRTRSYDVQDGTKRFITEIYAESIQLLGKKGDGAPGDTNRTSEQPHVNEPSNNQNSYTNNGDKEGDDLPF
jgi:single-strand DNA-binding protein